MKKLVTLVAVAVIGLAGAFALDFNDIVKTAKLEGTGVDANYNANWIIGADADVEAYIKIADAKSGKVYTTFKQSNVQDFDIKVDLNPLSSDAGVTISWKSKTWGKSYKLYKGDLKSKDLSLSIVREWDPEPYDDQVLKFVGAGADVDTDIDGAIDTAVDEAADAIER